MGALYICEQTKRPLIVDWTGMAALRDKQINYFPAFFEPIRRWRDVDVFYVNDPDVPARSVSYQAEEAFEPGDDQYRELATGKAGDRNVCLRRFHYYTIFRRSPLTPSAVFHRTRDFFRELAPRPALRRRIADLQPRFERSIVVALHVRSGNGEFERGKP